MGARAQAPAAGTTRDRALLKTEAQTDCSAPGSQATRFRRQCRRSPLSALPAGSSHDRQAGWGCSRWREGCNFVVWFEESGVRRSEADLREMVSKP